MLPAVSTIASHQSHATNKTAKDVTKLLKCLAAHPDAKICYRASNMVMHMHSNTYYLSEEIFFSHGDGHFFLITVPINPLCQPQFHDPMHTKNVKIIANSIIMKPAISLVDEYELVALFFN